MLVVKKETAMNGVSDGALSKALIEQRVAAIAPPVRARLR